MNAGALALPAQDPPPFVAGLQPRKKKQSVFALRSQLGDFLHVPAIPSTSSQCVQCPVPRRHLKNEKKGTERTLSRWRRAGRHQPSSCEEGRRRSVHWR